MGGDHYRRPNFNTNTMKTIEIGKDYKITMIENTQKQIENLIQSGVERVNLHDMQTMLAQIGLTLDLNENGYLYLYYNTSNENHYYEATTSPLDFRKISAYNINSDFYNKYLRGYESAHGDALRKIRNNYFCTYTKRGIEYILSF